MQSYKKGAITRIHIVEKARIQFNEKGIGLTIEQLAQELKLTKSRITNHFPTKDSLFLAIIGDYEAQLAAYFASFEWGSAGSDFPNLKRLLLGAMDIQYEYRCSIAYSTIIMPTGNELAQKIEANAKLNRENIKRRLSTMIDSGLLDARILEDSELEVFLSGYLNLLTTWVITFDLYQPRLSKQDVQLSYVQSIFRCYIPYLTRKGKRNFLLADLML
jgi:AcrR family transcriptional regulator